MAIFGDVLASLYAIYFAGDAACHTRCCTCVHDMQQDNASSMQPVLVYTLQDRDLNTPCHDMHVHRHVHIHFVPLCRPLLTQHVFRELCHESVERVKFKELSWKRN